MDTKENKKENIPERKFERGDKPLCFFVIPTDVILVVCRLF